LIETEVGTNGRERLNEKGREIHIHAHARVLSSIARESIAGGERRERQIGREKKRREW